jgi:WS/DGAT/MGAT family acyltransferase
MERRPSVPIERLGAGDLMFLALQGSTVPEQFGAVLVLDPTDGFDLASATALLADRVSAVPRLRQRIMRVPPGCGRPVWVDDGDFAPARHIRHVVCPAPGDEPALLDVAADLVTRPLPMDRPLWTAAFVTGLAAGRVALVIVIQHALSDGVGGLAVLDALVDGAPAAAQRPFPVPPPSAGRLARDAAGSRLRGLAGLAAEARSAARARRVKAAAAAGSPPARRERVGRAAACSLLQVTGPRRRVAVVRASLDRLRDVAHAHGATVNDVLLTAVGGALGDTLEGRGEHVPGIVVSFPISQRHSASTEDLGNRLRVTRAVIPCAGGSLERLGRVAAVTRERKAGSASHSAGVAASAVVRALFLLGLYQRYLRRQRYLHTVVTDVHGPDEPRSFGGAPVVEVLPLAVGGGGNVTVTFAALSYAGTLAVSVTADPGRMPDLARTACALGAELGVRRPR